MKLPERELLTKQKQRVLLHSLFQMKSGNYLLIRRMDNGELGQRKRRHRRLLISDGITRKSRRVLRNPVLVLTWRPAREILT